MKELRFPPCGTYTSDELAILRDARVTTERVLDEAFQVPTIAKLRAERYAAKLDEIRHIASSTKWHDTPDLRASLRMILDLCDGRDEP